MSEFQQVKKRGSTELSGGGNASIFTKYPEQYRTLSEMGFDVASISKALESTSGNLEASTAVLLGEPSNSSLSVALDSSTSKPPPPMKVVGKQQAQSTKTIAQKPDIKEVHNKFMATYKIQKCKDKSNHDKRMCIYWHTKNDRRRNPFEIPYTCTECPNSTEPNVCDVGDACLKAHNMLERMFHPELFKISMCQRGPNGSHCERGNLCAFAHSDEDHRIPLSHTLSKSASASGTGTGSGHNLASSGVAVTGNTDPIQPGKAMSDSRLLDGIQEKLIRLIKNQGADGIISSELPKRFFDVYSERLELTDEAGEKFRIKDLLLSHPCITVSMHKGVQPKYVYDEAKSNPPPVEVESAPTPSIATVPHINPLVNSSLVTSGASYSAIVNHSNIINSAGSSPRAALNTLENSTDGIVARARRRGPSTNPLDPFDHEAVANMHLNNEHSEGYQENSPAKNNSFGLKIGEDSLNTNSLLFQASTTMRNSSYASGNGLSLDYSHAVSGGRRRGPDHTGISVSNSQSEDTRGMPSIQGSPGSSSSSSAPSPHGIPSLLQPHISVNSSLHAADFSMGSASSAVLTLQQQVSNLHSELTSKSHELDSQAQRLKTTQQLLSECESKLNFGNNLKDSLLIDMQKTRVELDAAKQKLLENEEELSVLRMKESSLNRLKQEKLADLNLFRLNISQVETALIETQRKESIYINEISLHDTINESSRARDELTKFVTMIKNNLSTKIQNETVKQSGMSFPAVGMNINSVGMANSIPVNASDSHGMAMGGVVGDGFSSPVRPVSGGASNQLYLNMQSQTQSQQQAQQQQQQSSQSYLSAVSQQPPPSPFMMMAEDKNEISIINHSHMGVGAPLVDAIGAVGGMNLAGLSTMAGMGGMGNVLMGINHSEEHVHMHVENGYHQSQQHSQQNSHMLICALPGCFKEGSYVCSACGKVGYCGAEHQRNHWASHVNECSPRI